MEPGPPGAAVAPSPTPARASAPGHLFRPISAEDEEQQPTEIESLCMNCFRNVRRGAGAGGGGLSCGRPGGRGPGYRAARGQSLGSAVPSVLSLAPFCLPGNDTPAAHQDPLLPRNNRELLFLRALRLEQHGDPVGRQDPGPGSALHPGRQGPGGERSRGRFRSVARKAWGLSPSSGPCGEAFVSKPTSPLLGNGAGAVISLSEGLRLAAVVMRSAVIPAAWLLARDCSAGVV